MPLEPPVSENQPSGRSTYQSEIDKIVKKLDEMIERESVLPRPESLEDATGYADCNLNEVINFCENYKLEARGERKSRRKPEKNETCFLNQSPKTEATPVYTEQMDPLRMSRSCSVGFLDDVDTGLVPCQLSLILLKRDAPKRLFLVRKKPARKPKTSHSFDSSEFLTALRRSDDDRREDGDSELEDKQVSAKAVAMPTVRCTAPPPFEPDIFEPAPCPFSPFDLPRSSRSRVERPEHAHSQPASPAMGKKKREPSSSPIR